MAKYEFKIVNKIQRITLEINEQKNLWMFFKSHTFV